MYDWRLFVSGADVSTLAEMELNIITLDARWIILIYFGECFAL